MRLLFQNTIQIGLCGCKIAQHELVPREIAARCRVAGIEAQGFFQV